MKKVVINLNPQRENISSLALQNVISYTPLAAISAVLGLVLILLLNLVALNKAHSRALYNKRWKEWSEKYQTLQEAKLQAEKLEAEKGALDKILTPDYQMASVLEDIFSALPKNIWFESFDFHGQVLKIEGYIAKWNRDYLASLDDFIKSLRQKEYFSSKFGVLEIDRSEKSEFNGQEVLKFSIICKK